MSRTTPPRRQPLPPTEGTPERAHQAAFFGYALRMVGWARFGGGSLLVVLAACGGRTSTFDDGSYGGASDGGGEAGNGATTSGGGSAAGSSAGGAAGNAQGGSAGSAAGGPSSGGMSGGTGARTQTLCLDYCGALLHGPCPMQFGGDMDCFTSCTGGLTIGNDACLELGSQMLSCINRVLEKPPSQCSNLLDNAQTLCEPQIFLFTQCSQSVPPTAFSCESSGGGTSNGCNATTKCNDGSYYTAQCMSVGDGLSNCTCTSGSGPSASLTLNESLSYACQDALAACGAPFSK